MPISVGRKGVAAAVANPALGARLGRSRNVGASLSVGGDLAFRSPPFNATSLYISGVTRDSTGAVLGGCVVQLFRTSDDAIIAEQVSDGSTGAYSFPILVGGPFYVVAYKAGTPDLAGTTVNTLTGA